MNALLFVCALAVCSPLLAAGKVYDYDPMRTLVLFRLYTRDFQDKNQAQPLYVNDTKALAESDFDSRRPTKFVIHGYLDGYTDDNIQKLKDAFLFQGDYNVIAVDWQFFTKATIYNEAVNNVPLVGYYTARFVDFLVQSAGISTADVHLVGHSLGAHVSGFCGKNVRYGQVGRISGLDPAGPLFDYNKPQGRLNDKDAAFVDCIHTCAGIYGIKQAICQSDFFPNGGTHAQPGCNPLDFGVCSHGRSVDLYVESIDLSHEFISFACPQFSVDNGPSQCILSDVLMGYPANPSKPGIYYTFTQSQPPYAFVYNFTQSENFINKL